MESSRSLLNPLADHQKQFDINIGAMLCENDLADGLAAMLSYTEAISIKILMNSPTKKRVHHLFEQARLFDRAWYSGEYDCMPPKNERIVVLQN